jgi:hypothetical protein
MPNWCNNVLTVTGKPADLLEFKLYAEGHGIFWSGEDEIATDEDREKYFSCMDFSQFVRPTATELDLPYSQHDLEKLMATIGSAKIGVLNGTLAVQTFHRILESMKMESLSLYILLILLGHLYLRNC